MKLYLTDGKRINIFSLPKKIEDTFFINYKSDKGIEEAINLVANDGKWMINSNPETTFYEEGHIVDNAYLEDGSIYQVKFSDIADTLTIYTYDIPMKCDSYDVANQTEITIGRDPSCSISYDDVNIATQAIKITKQNNIWIYEVSGNAEVYINNFRCNKAILKPGDVVFLNGIKIVWVDFFVRINTTKKKLTVRLQQEGVIDIREIEYVEENDSEKGSVLYDDNEVFFHTPRLKETITKHEINIQTPPKKNEQSKTPAFLALGGTMMMGISSSISGVIAIFSVIQGKATLFSAISEIVICVSMLLGSIFFPMLLDKYQKRQDKKYEKKRQVKYKEYLNNKIEEINKLMQKEKQIMLDNNLSVKEIQNAIVTKSSNVWSREITDADFLSVRLGIGTCKPNITVKANLDEFSLDDDNLRIDVKNLVEKKLMLEEVPVTASLIDDRILPIIIKNDHPNRQQFIDAVMLQLITYYSGVDLKLIVITSQERKDKWEYLKYLYHCRSNDSSELFFATTEEEIKQINSTLEKVRQERIKFFAKESENEESNISSGTKEDDANHKYKAFDTYYLVVTDNFGTAKRHEFINNIVNSKVNLGFSILMFEPNMQNVPSKCNHFVYVEQGVSGMFSKDLSEDNQKTFNAEYQMDNNNDQYAQILANIPIVGSNTTSSLPPSLNFLEMYKVGKIEQLNIANRWINNNPTLSLHAPVGVQADGKLFELDLHEKAHGPHGLIAGATGSGKSEFIIGYILSMALNYHPYEVQFVLIDYKGGGLTGAFQNKEANIVLPHLAGTITNLDTAEMNRTLVSIKSELKRRQREFNKARDALSESTVDIYKYQKFYRDKKVSEPISHLFIISDEFAELKDQQPEFMDELVSIARIGRSLGVHLILATQKPSGVVDNQIWSNSRFKISLKVQTEEDSNELLKRPDAASIKETGRFYLQVGFNEIFEMGQAGWAGAKYVPTDRITKSINDDIEFVDNNGNSIKKINRSIKAEAQVDYGDQLSNLVKSICSIAQRDGIVPKTLWLPSLNPFIYIPELIQKYQYTSNPFTFDILIGEYDVPENQFQDKLTIDLLNGGNVLITGISGSGKENILTTIMYMTCLYHTSNEVNFYILDFGAEVLNPFIKFPQVGDIATAIDKDKLTNHFTFLEREINKRKELFKEFGGSYDTYIKQSGNTLPLIVTVLNNFESFMEDYDYLDDQLTSLLRESAKYGVIFITTVIASNAIRPSIVQLYGTRMMLQIGDPFDYIYQLDAPKNLLPAKQFGRGLIKLTDGTYEFQSAYVFQKDRINEVLRETAEKLQALNMPKAPHIPSIPKEVSFETMLSEVRDIDAVPLGYNLETAEVNRYNFIEKKITFISGNQINTEPQFLLDLVNILATIPSIEVKIIDIAGNMAESEIEERYDGEFTSVISSIVTAEQETKQKIIYIITGIGYVYDRVLDEGIEQLFSILDGSTVLPNSYFILADNYVSMRKLEKEPWYQYADRNSGIWIGQGFANQNVIQIDHFNSYDSNEDFKGLTFVAHDRQYEVIKGIGSKEPKGW